MWPYKGADCKELELQLGKDFIENAFEDDEAPGV